MKKYKDLDGYIKAQPKEVQPLLRAMRETIRKSAPKATEAIKYSMPTFVGTKNLVHFAAFKKHIGFFPTPSAVAAFMKDLSKFKTSKGAIQFPLDAKLPLPLVARMVKFRVKEDSILKNR